MSTSAPPDPSDPIAATQAPTAGTSMVIEQRPLGEFARGSYVWPAWVVMGLALGAVALVAGNQLRGRLKGKAQKK